MKQTISLKKVSFICGKCCKIGAYRGKWKWFGGVCFAKQSFVSENVKFVSENPIQKKAGAAMKKVTIYDVAKTAGVSPATVSRVLNQQGYISPEMFRKVERAMDELGYQRKSVSSAFATSGARVIGVLIPDIRYEHCTNIVFHIEAILSQQGYSCILCNANNSYDKALQDLNTLVKRRVDGLILVNSFFAAKPVVEWIRNAELRIPIVSVFCQLDIPHSYSIQIDMDEASDIVIGRLAEKGKRFLALIQSKVDPGSVWHKNSFIRVAKNKFDKLSPVTITLQQVTIEAGYKAARKLFREHPSIDALIFDSTLPAIGACRCLQDMKFAIPGEVAVCATDMLSISEVVRPKLACIDNHQDLMGREAARTILDLINGLERPHRLLMSVDLLERETL